MRSSVFNLVIVLVGVCFLASLPVSATIHNITVGNNFFSPLGTIADVGDTVRWTWAGGIIHSTTSDPGADQSWDSGITGMAGFTFEIEILPSPQGRLPYICVVHPFTMIDTIWVNEVVSCCTLRGDANSDGQVCIRDLVQLINTLFITFEPLVCSENGDMNDPPDGKVDIRDLVAIINALFITFNELPACS